MRRLFPAVALVLLWPALASAQAPISPFPQGVTPPIFGIASAVDGGGSFTPQLFGPQSCTVPAYSFTSATTSGYGFASSTACIVVGGTGNFFVAANSVQQRNSTTAQRFDVANTYTSSISNELFSVDWQTTANIALVGTRTAATGTARALLLGAQNTNAANAYAAIKLDRSSVPFVRMGLGAADGTFAANTASTGNLFQVSDLTSTATSGSVISFAITPTYNQASGNAANTDLLINRTQTLVGSGAQLLADFQVGGASKASIDNVGRVAGLILQGTGTGTSVANVGANSCGTTTATIAGNQVSGVITVGATAGTQCRVTFSTAAPVARDCTVTDSTTTIATRATVVDTTNTDFLGAFVAGDKITYQCTVR